MFRQGLQLLGRKSGRKRNNPCVPEYTFEEFCEIAVTRLGKEKVDENIAITIAEKVWSELGSKDIRDVIKISRLSRSSEDVSFVVKMLKKK